MKMPEAYFDGKSEVSYTYCLIDVNIAGDTYSLNMALCLVYINTLTLAIFSESREKRHACRYRFKCYTKKAGCIFWWCPWEKVCGRYYYCYSHY